MRPLTSFDDIGLLADHCVRELFERSSKTTLAMAMVGATDRVRARVFSRLRPDELRALSAVMAALGTLPKSEAFSAQALMFSTLLDMAACDALVWMDDESLCEPWVDAFRSDGTDPALVAMVLESVKECAKAAIGKPPEDMEDALLRIVELAEIGEERAGAEDLPDWIAECATDICARAAHVLGADDQSPARDLRDIPDLSPEEALRQSNARIRFLENDIREWRTFAVGAPLAEQVARMKMALGGFDGGCSGKDVVVSAQAMADLRVIAEYIHEVENGLPLADEGRPSIVLREWIGVALHGAGIAHKGGI